jgi:multidrug resistance efflux pump
MKGSGLLWAALSAVVAGGGLAAFLQFREKAPPPAAAESPADPAPPELTIAGTIRARHVVPVAAPVDGVLEAMDLLDGQEVFEGQLLAQVRSRRLDLELEEAKLEVERLQERVNRLDSLLIGARLEASRADAEAARVRAALALAEKDYLRQKTLFAEGATPRLTYEKAEREYQALKSEAEAVAGMAQATQARLDVAQKNLDEARRLLAEKQQDLETVESTIQEGAIHAPADGILLAHRAGPGDEVTTAMKDLFQIAVNLGELNFTAPITSAQEKLLTPGQAVLLQVAELGGLPIEGKIRSAEKGELVVEFSSPDAAVRPGLSAQVRVPLKAALRPSAPTPRTSSGSH